jgi:hypothetical protein
MAKKKVSGSVYQLKITLRDIKPPIWRRVQVEDCSLFKLYVVIQTTWASRRGGCGAATGA